MVSRARAHLSDGAVLQDVDRLEPSVRSASRNLCDSAGHVEPGKPLVYDPEDPLARSGRALDDKRQPVDHFLPSSSS